MVDGKSAFAGAVTAAPLQPCNSRSRVNKALVNRSVNKKSSVSKLGVSKQVSTETHILEPVRKVWCAAWYARNPLFLGAYLSG